MKLRDLTVCTGIAVIAIGIYDVVRGSKPRVAATEAPAKGEQLAASTSEQLAQLQQRLERLEHRVDGLPTAARVPAEGAQAGEEKRPRLDASGAQPPDLEGMLTKLVDDGGLKELKDRYEQQVLEHWRGETPDPKPELVAEGQLKLNEAVDDVYAALEGANGDPEKAKAALAERLKGIEFENPGQVTVVDRDGNYVYHLAGLKGSSAFYKNVNGDSAYAGMLQSKQASGNMAYYDFIQDDRAREVNLTYRKLNDLGWFVLIENYEWKEMQ